MKREDEILPSGARKNLVRSAGLPLDLPSNAEKRRKHSPSLA